MSKRWIIFAIGASCLVAGCEAGKTGGGKTPPSKVENGVAEQALTTVTLTADAEKRLGVETAPLRMQSVQNTQSFAGIVAPAPGARSVVSAPFTGILVAPEGGLAKPGESVETGAPIVLLLGVATSTNGVSPAEELRVKKLELDNARARLERTSELVEARGASEEEREAARAEVARAEAAYNSVLAQLNGGDGRKGGVAIRAPFAGVLGVYAAGVGQLVSAGAPLFTVTNLDDALVRVPMFPGEADEIAADAVASVAPLNADNGGAFSAARIAGPPTASAANASIDLYFTIDNSKARFRPDERVEVAVPLGGQGDRLVAPHSAIFTDIHGGTWVYEKLRDGVYARRRVLIDYLAGDLAVLAEGPGVGREVVSVGVAELAGSEFGVGK